LVVEELRMMKSQSGIKPSEKLPVVLKCDEKEAEFFRLLSSTILSLTRNETMTVITDGEKPEASLSAAVRGVEVFLIASNAIDVDKERERLSKDLERMQNLKRSAESKLNNERFVASAKAEVVEAERTKLKTAEEGIANIDEALKKL
jgi:valyl-tRNA synthetase